MGKIELENEMVKAFEHADRQIMYHESKKAEAKSITTAEMHDEMIEFYKSIKLEIMQLLDNLTDDNCAKTRKLFEEINSKLH